jgi:CubicO group peptidase (beta-lactamase class C family)
MALEKPPGKPLLLIIMALSALATSAFAEAGFQGQPPTADVGYEARGIRNTQEVARAVANDGEYPQIVALLALHGRILAFNAYEKGGTRGTERPLKKDSIFAIASMSKPVIAVAMMILYEEGRWTPQDPISKYIPQFAHLKVYKGMSADGRMLLEDPVHPPTMGELLSHTAGFTYGAFGSTPVDVLYAKARLFQQGSLAAMIDKLAGIPLLYQPGTHWVYSISADIEGYVIQVLSGEPLPRFLKERIFAPLGMKDTDFYVPKAKRRRLAVMYETGAHGELERIPASASMLADHEPAEPNGGGGLFSTAADYFRFAQMLLSGGALDGVRILSPATVRLMTSNHLSPAISGGEFLPGQPGVGYGYGFGIYTNPALAGSPVGRGTYFWGGIDGTLFWIDPRNSLVFVGMVQRSFYRWSGHGGEVTGEPPNLVGMLQAAVYSGVAPSPHQPDLSAAR